MKNNTAVMIQKMPEAARTMKTNAWIRPLVMSGATMLGILPRFGEEYRAALEALDDNDRFRLDAALRTSHAHYKVGSDIYGVVGIPLFLGLLAAVNIIDLSFEAFLAYGAILIFYFLIYTYYRSMQGTAEALVEIGNLADRMHRCEQVEEK